MQSIASHQIIAMLYPVTSKHMHMRNPGQQHVCMPISVHDMHHWRHKLRTFAQQSYEQLHGL